MKIPEYELKNTLYSGQLTIGLLHSFKNQDTVAKWLAPAIKKIVDSYIGRPSNKSQYIMIKMDIDNLLREKVENHQLWFDEKTNSWHDTIMSEPNAILKSII